MRRTLGVRWGLMKLPIDRLVEFESAAVQAQEFVDMHYELKAPAEQKQAFVNERQGALVSVELAHELGWKVGDIVHFKHGSFPGDIVLTISGIFESSRKGFARRAIYFHLEYLNELLPPSEQDRVNIVVSEIVVPQQGARIAKALLGLAGGVLGLVLSYPLVGQAASRYLEESMRLPPLHISAESGQLAIFMGALLGAIAGAVPAFQLLRMKVVDSLRSVG